MIYEQLTNDEDDFKRKSKLFRPLKCGQSLNTNEYHFIDLRHPQQYYDDLKEVAITDNDILNCKNGKSRINEDFEPFQNWQMYSLINTEPGLYAIPKILTPSGCAKWFDEFLYKIPKRDYFNFRSNLNLPLEYNKINEYSKLRWLTFGYHYNWNSKLYSSEDHSPISDEITSLFDYIINRTQFKLKIEAGIINYYTCKSVLNPHSDHSEINQTAPLLSLSLGTGSALFVIGGHERVSCKKVTALLLNAGDLLIMSSSSRLAYHSVLKVICDEANCDRRKIKRININIRQVY